MSSTKIKLIRITTVPLSLQKLISGQMLFMKQNGFEVSMISSDFKEKDQLERKENARFIPVNMQRNISVFKDFWSLWRLISQIRKLKPDIIHTHTPKAGLLGMLAARITRTPIRLHTVAGLPLMEATGLKRKILEWTEILTYACANKVYPNSKNLKKFIIENNFCAADKLKVIGNGSSNGINTEFFKLTPDVSNIGDLKKSEFNISDDNFVYVFVGRLVKDKGIEELIGAFSILSKQYPKIRLLLVGPYEPERDPLSDICMKNIQENDSIINVGFKNDVRPYLAISDALVFPSYREGFPNVPMQAGCFDLPSIVTDINGCNEIIDNGKNGLIIPPKNIKALKESMELLITDDELYNKLKSNARKMIIERYEQTHFWSLLLNEYKEQMKRHGIS